MGDSRAVGAARAIACTHAAWIGVVGGAFGLEVNGIIDITIGALAGFNDIGGISESIAIAIAVPHRWAIAITDAALVELSIPVGNAGAVFAARSISVAYAAGIFEGFAIDDAFTIRTR